MHYLLQAYQNYQNNITWLFSLNKPKQIFETDTLAPYFILLSTLYFTKSFFDSFVLHKEIEADTVITEV